MDRIIPIHLLQTSDSAALPLLVSQPHEMLLAIHAELTQPIQRDQREEFPPTSAIFLQWYLQGHVQSKLSSQCAVYLSISPVEKLIYEHEHRFPPPHLDFKGFSPIFPRDL